MAKIATTAMKNANDGKRVYDVGMTHKVLASNSSAPYKTSGR